MSRPFIMTIDDDPAVLQILARDLRSQYGAMFRVLSSDCAKKALEMLDRLAARGESVALLLADQRMPHLSGVEFLERSLDIFPEAKRALLTAYADTRSAIAAINQAQIHYYLTKPWLPPEANLYPVLDELLETWREALCPTFEQLQIIGPRWLPKTHQIKDFLARHHVPYLWRNPETDEQARQMLSTKGKSPQLPLVLFPDGSHLEAPNQGELANRIGLKTRAEMPFYDLIVVGGGPAGLAAAVYGSSEGLNTLLIERKAPGGQAGTSSKIENYLGFPAGVSGGELTRRAIAQAYKFGTEILTPQQVTDLQVEGQYRIVTLADGSQVSCHALIVATGASYVKLEVPGIEKLVGAGVYYGAAITEAIACQGEQVSIIGGANSAGQAAVCLSQYARQVTLLVRGNSLSDKMSQYLVKQIEAKDNITVKSATKVQAVAGRERLESLLLSERSLPKAYWVDCEALFIFIGAKPNTVWLNKLIACNQDGFILTGTDLMVSGAGKRWLLERQPYPFETSVPGVFAVGDVRSSSIKRVASAVGEGSVAVRLVHEYLSSF